MEILEQPLQSYLENHCPPEPELLQSIDRETNLNVLKPHMISGHYQGRLLSMLSKMQQPKCILEIGSFTGYSALCLAEGLTDGGILHTIEVNPEMEERLQKNFAASVHHHKIKLHIGDATAVMATMPSNLYDLVFIDADKKSNALYYQMVMEQVRPGGLIVIDNVLWKGKVYADVNDNDTRLIRQLNDMIHADARVESLILPVRDGLTVIRKL